MYTFYNHQGTCDLATAAGKATLQGINISDGYIIERLFQNGEKNRQSLYPFIFPFSDLFCLSLIKARKAQTGAPSLSPQIPPLISSTPENIRERLVTMRENVLAADATSFELSEVPEVSSEISPEIRQIVQR